MAKPVNSQAADVAREQQGYCNPEHFHDIPADIASSVRASRQTSCAVAHPGEAHPCAGGGRMGTERIGRWDAR